MTDFASENPRCVWWGRDDGDDNLLWYDVDYTYYQPLCQYRCHFSGQETFVAFGMRADGDRWISGWENPFLFYDPDNDQCSEVVLRIEGLDDQVRAIRYSFDADDDAHGRRTHDYDFSISARSDPEHPVQLPKGVVESMTLRGIPTQAWLHRDKARNFVENASWTNALLTWDELNANSEGNFKSDPQERWEGVIARGSDAFQQIGGPAVSAFNKRNELSLKPRTPMKLYYDSADRRLHLSGAGQGWLHVDFDLDDKADAKYTWFDDDSNGIFDRRALDLDADGVVDFEWPMDQSKVRDIPLEFESLSGFYKQVLRDTLADSQAFIDAAKWWLGTKQATHVPVELFFLQKVSHWMPQTRLGERIRSTPAGARLYVDLVRDRLLFDLKKHLGGEGWQAIETAYARGNYRESAEIIEKLAVAQRLDPQMIDWSADHVDIRIENPHATPRHDWPITLPVSRIKAAASGFNPLACTIVSTSRWLDCRELPHQVDIINADSGPELSFLADLPAKGSTTLRLFYQPEGRSTSSFPTRTGTAEDWIQPNIGWESNRIAYRAYWGQLDFFGKKTDRLIYGDIGKKNYHDETDWGIDALLVRDTSGCGGVTLYLGDKAYPVQNPAGKGDIVFTKRVVAQGPVRSVIEWEAGNIVPDRPELKVTTRCHIYAERQETEVRVQVHGAKNGEAVALAPGLMKLAHEKAFAEPAKGCFGSWGYQTPAIGDIGMAIIGTPDMFIGEKDMPQKRRYQFKLDSEGKLRYWIVADWRRGRQHPIGPTVDNWKREVTALAGMLLKDTQITIEPN